MLDIYGIAEIAKTNNNVEQLTVLRDKYANIFPILTSLLSNPNLPEFLLEDIYFTNEDKEIRLRAVAHPNVSERIVTDFFTHVETNKGKTGNSYRTSLFNNYRNIILNIIGGAPSWVQVQKYSTMFKTILTPLVQHSVPLSSKTSPMFQQSDIINLETLHSTIMTAEVMNVHTPGDHISHVYQFMSEKFGLTSGRHTQFFYYTATHVNTPSHVLAELCENSNALWVKMGLSKNPNTPFDALMCDNIWLNIGGNSEELVGNIVSREEFNEQFAKYFSYSDRVNKISAQVLLKSGKLDDVEKTLLVLQYGNSSV